MQPLNDRERRAWYGFLTMQEDLRRHINRQLLQDSGLSWADFAVLSGLSQQSHGSLRVFELRALLRWEKTRLVHQVSRMVARGLLERRASAEDARGSHVALTDAGWNAIHSAAPAHLEDIRRTFFDVLSPRQIDTLAAVADAVLENIELQESESADGT